MKQVRSIRIACSNRECNKNFLGQIYEGEKKARLLKCNKCNTAIYFAPKNSEKGFEIEIWEGNEVIVSAPMNMTASIVKEKIKEIVTK